MSSAAKIDQLVISNYCGAAVAVMILYQYLITFRQEIDLFWRRKWSGASVLFFSNRYIAVAVAILNLIQYGPLSDESCGRAAPTSYTVQVLIYFPGAAFSGLRAFALTQSLILASVIFLLSSVPVAVNLARFKWKITGVHLPPFGCNYGNGLSATEAVKLVVASRSCLMIADFALIVITWTVLVRRSQLPTSRRYKLSEGLGKTPLSLAGVLLHDGVLYFAVLLVINSLHLALSFLSSTRPGDLQNSSYVTIFSEPITAILVSHFLMDLQTAHQQAIDCADSQVPTQTSSVVFDRVIGSLASSINFRHNSSGDAAYSDEDEFDSFEEASESTKNAANGHDVEMVDQQASHSGVMAYR